MNLRTICQRATQKSIGNFCEGHLEFIDQFGQSCYFKITRVFPSINMIYSVILTRPLKELILFFNRSLHFMSKYLIYLANVNGDCFHILSYVSTCVLIGYFSRKEMVLLFF